MTSLKKLQINILFKQKRNQDRRCKKFDFKV